MPDFTNPRIALQALQKEARKPPTEEEKVDVLDKIKAVKKNISYREGSG